MTFQNANYFYWQGLCRARDYLKILYECYVRTMLFPLDKNFKERLTLAEGFSKDKRKI